MLLPYRTQMKWARQWHNDSTAADSSVEPNTVAPNSKDKTNHPSSGISPVKMAEGNLSKDHEKVVLFETILNARRHRKCLHLFFSWLPLKRASSKFLYYDRAGVFKGTLVGGTQFGTPILKNDLNKLYVLQGEPFSSSRTELEMT